MLQIQNLTKYYTSVPVVNDVTFTVRPGEVTGYLGPNGSGKSTTVKMITGLVEPSRGRVLFRGRDIREDMTAFRRLLGYVPEEAILYPYLTGLEYLQLIGRLRELPEKLVNERALRLLELFQLHAYRYTPLSSYSKGMRQRVLISAALMHDPELLILDEPLSGMDATSAHLFKYLLEELAARGKMILYISHVLEVVERVCQRVLVIHRGVIKADNSVTRLREMMGLPSLEAIFAELTEQRDLPAVAREIAHIAG